MYLNCSKKRWLILKLVHPTMPVQKSGKINLMNSKVISGLLVFFTVIQGCIIYEMCALRPPFTANSMDGLYKKVLKGAYPRIPPAYSNDLEKLIAKCLKIDPKNRPTAKELLKIIPSYDSESEDTKSSINLLNTIKIPRTDMHNSECWKDQLPKSNYMNQSLEEEKDYDRGKPLNFGH